MASFLARAFDLPAAEPKGFGDVEGHGHEDNINRIAAVGITVGCGDRTNYCPSRLTSRAEMAVFISRAIKYFESQEAAPATGDLPTLAVGFGHTCMVRADGTIACWGGGSAAVPGGTFKSVAVTAGHSCALRTDGAVLCWGSNSRGQSVPPEGSFKAISVETGISCGIRTDGTVACWGDNEDGQADPPSGAFKSITMGWRHACGIRTDDTAACWGSNYESGRNPDYLGQADPPAGEFKTIVASFNHTCGIRANNFVACWGSNDGGWNRYGGQAPSTSGDLQDPGCWRPSHVWDPHRRQGHLLGALQVRQA